ncbi:PIN domain-containing protein [Patescibacteria group bacterium]|nr:PIN domain-containing protein [Patescibacteria group bacterium]
MIFVDTNFFLRFFLQDNSPQFRQAKKLFHQASSGQATLGTSLIVFFEVYWVLSSLYGRKHELVLQTLLAIANMDFVFLPQRQLLKTCLANFSRFNYDLEDTYNFFYAQSKKVSEFATFDKKLKEKFILFSQDVQNS